MPLPAFTAAINKAKAESFYLDSPDGEFASLADVTVVSATGAYMPAHSQVLAQASSVLCTLFVSQEDESGICKDSTDMICISEPFKSYCTYQVACFLRFIYHPEEACTANFKAMGSQLTSVVHLAHHLNAAALLAKLDTYLSEAVDTATAEHAVAWLHLSEQCNLHKLRVKCIRQVVHALGSMGRGSYSCYDSSRQRHRGAVAAVADVDPLLKDLSHEALLHLVAICVATIRSINGYNCVPSVVELEQALLPQ